MYVETYGFLVMLINHVRTLIILVYQLAGANLHVTMETLSSHGKVTKYVVVIMYDMAFMQ